MQPEQMPAQPPAQPQTPSPAPTVTPPSWQQPETPLSPPPKKRLSLSRTKLLIILGILLVIVIGAALLFSHKTNKPASNNGQITADGKYYYFRSGYDIKQYGSLIGDPLAINTSKTGAPVNLSSGPLVYACNVLTIADLNAQKAYVGPRSDERGMSQNYVDNVGKATPASELYTVVDGDKANECTYNVNGSYLQIDVYQIPFAGAGTITDELNRRYAQTTSIGGLPTYKLKSEGAGSATYILKSGNAAFQVYFSSDKHFTQTQIQNLLGTAAHNFASLQATPKGPVQPYYDTPTFTQKYAKACDYISNDDIKSLTGSDASIYGFEGWGTSTGVAKAKGQLYDSVTTSCQRFNTDLGSGLTAGPFDQKLEVTITSFTGVPAADLFLQASSDGSEKAKVAIGDDGLGYRDTSSQNALIFRQGRFVVQVMFDRTVQRNAGLQDTAAMTQKLTPYAQSVATKLKTLE
ncbi:MAG TPA: hypothetical protein VJR27_02615 [Candidatus Saccharimonadales bacterium]|nr:hypothetical protein [Candidatus Saccharimonadales bacterium]